MSWRSHVVGLVTLMSLSTAGCNSDRCATPTCLDPLPPDLVGVGQGLSRELWTVASSPEGLSLADRGKATWYNRFDPYRLTEIYNVQALPADDRTQVLTLKVSAGAAAADPWGGIMRSVGAPYRDWSHITHVELRVQADAGLLVINLGQISEDLDNDGTLDTEDKLRQGVRNGILDDDEDTGLDGLFNDEEPGYDPVTNPDPNGDDWYYDESNRYDYSRINGTEGNRPDPLQGGKPDTEDLDGNDALDVLNNYFEYTVDLADPADPFLVPNSEFCDGCSDVGRLGPWRTFRIPLADSNAVGRMVGSPSLQSIHVIRIYMKDVPALGGIQVNVADFRPRIPD